MCDRPTNIPRFLSSFWGGWTLCTPCNYWECLPVASRVRLTPTKTQNEGKISDSGRSLLYQSGGGPMVYPYLVRDAPKRVLPPSEGGVELLDLECLGSVPFDTVEPTEGMFGSRLGGNPQRNRVRWSMTIGFLHNLRFLGPPATDNRGNVPRRKQI